MELFIIIVYGLALTFIFCYSIVQINLVYSYTRNKEVGSEMSSGKGIGTNVSNLPKVTVQLPIYNEKYVVARLIDAVVKLDYPKHLLEIQVLDDSDDDTVEIIQERVAYYQELGIYINRIKRENRVGYKAGALSYGLDLAKGEFIAIFDADFIPNADFLLRTVVYFENAKVGMVQTRWDHLNKHYSILTELQAFGLDAHFSVEQKGRNLAGHFINFNGTAGIWRKSTIVDAGGWQADTLTEDLDLSYRAQLKGWRFEFLEDCGSPAELPAAMSALKTQQFRWTKGAAQCTRKNLWQVLKSKDFKFSTKVHAIFHLLNSSIFICIVITSLLSFPMLWIKQHHPEYNMLYKFAGLFLIGVLFLSIFYFVAYSRNSENKWKAFRQFLIKFPMFLSVSMGLSLHNGLAAVEGLIGRKSPFIRTPKLNIISSKDRWRGNSYVLNKISIVSVLELVLTVYFSIAVYQSFVYQDYGLLPFHLMLVFGFGYVSFYSLLQSLVRYRK